MTLKGEAKIDNTGKKQFVGSAAFPTLTFPSDHAVISAELQYGPKQQPLRVTAWNIAAINNNPFEYWMDSAGAEYETNARTTASGQG